MNNRSLVRYALLVPLLLSAPEAAFAQEASQELFTINNTWMLVATFLVFIMHLGFACLESGLTQAKNTVNILFKNTAIIAIGLVTYAFVGFNLMYPGDFNGFIGFAGFGLDPGPDGNTVAYADGAYDVLDRLHLPGDVRRHRRHDRVRGGGRADQAQLVSGVHHDLRRLLLHGRGLMEVGRWFPRRHGLLRFRRVDACALGGWMGRPWPGSSFSVPGWASTWAVRSRPLPDTACRWPRSGSSLLWLGWFGFNGGSVLSADPELVSLVFVTTSLAAATGVLGAMVTSWTFQHKPDLSMVLNGSLAGLVGYHRRGRCRQRQRRHADRVDCRRDRRRVRSLESTGCVLTTRLVPSRSTWSAGSGGRWRSGSSAPDHSLMTQLIGILAYGLFCFPAALGIFFVLKARHGDSRQSGRGSSGVGCRRARHGSLRRIPAWPTGASVAVRFSAKPAARRWPPRLKSSSGINSVWAEGLPGFGWGQALRTFLVRSSPPPAFASRPPQAARSSSWFAYNRRSRTRPPCSRLVALVGPLLGWLQSTALAQTVAESLLLTGFLSLGSPLGADTHRRQCPGFKPASDRGHAARHPGAIRHRPRPVLASGSA